jgi:hypothetical protein
MDPAQAFLVPQNSTHRQYEALRAYFVERLPAPQVAERFGGSSGFRCERRENPSLVNSGQYTTGGSSLSAPDA